MDNRHRYYLSQLSGLHRPLMLVVGLMVGLALVSAIGIFVDDRILIGVPIWEKPLKFALSFILYGTVLAALIPLLDKGRRLAGLLGTVIALGWVAEMSIIVLQVVRGRASHFNSATELDGMLFSAMGISIAFVWFASLGVAVMLWRHRFADRALGLAVRLGVSLSLIGAALGGLMIQERENVAVDMIGAHSVGVPDGGEVIPLLGWSMTGGDLRIPHFVGMHALQVLPLIALLLAWRGRRGTRLSSQITRVRLVAVAAIAYTALTALVSWQAWRGEPLIAPSGTVAVTALGLLLATATAVLLVLRTAPEPVAPQSDREPVDAH